MGVGVQREARGVVAQHGGHRFYVHPVLQGHRREGVAQVMKADAGQSNVIKLSRKCGCWGVKTTFSLLISRATFAYIIKLITILYCILQLFAALY